MWPSSCARTARSISSESRRNEKSRLSVRARTAARDRLELYVTKFVSQGGLVLNRPHDDFVSEIPVVGASAQDLDRYDRHIDPVEYAEIAGAKPVEGKASSFQSFDSRRPADGACRQHAQVIGDVVAICGCETIEIRDRSLGELDGDAHRACVLPT